MPIPTPISTKALHLSASTSGQVIVSGQQATEGAGEVLIENLSDGANVSAKVDASGNFAALIAANEMDELNLIYRTRGLNSEPVKIAVPSSSGLTAPAGQVTSPDTTGLVTASGTINASQSSANPMVAWALPKTSTVLVLTPAADGNFSGTLAAEVDDELYLFTFDAEGKSSVYRKLLVPSPSSSCTDADFDGFGAPGTDLSTCSSSATVADCNDTNEEVFPGQEQFFAAAIANAQPAVDFDYNCDGQEEQEAGQVLDCSAVQNCSGQGWQTAIPGCGEEGTWIECAMPKTTCVAQELGNKVQQCR